MDALRITRWGGYPELSGLVQYNHKDPYRMEAGGSILKMRIGPERRLSAKELMLSNCGAGEDSRIPWTARRSNQSILKEINPEYSLEGLLLKLQYFGHLM